MKFLVDENLSPRVAEFLLKSGNDAVHVGDRPAELVAMLVVNLDELEQHLLSGAVVAFTRTEIRVRPLPLR